MPLEVSCPRCTAPVTSNVAGAAPTQWVCQEHGVVPPLWRAAEATYETFVEHLAAAGAFPTYLPWPLAGGWRVTDFAAVGSPGAGRATMTAWAGVTEHDGPVEMIAVTEEPGTGLGARCAGIVHSDPGASIAGSDPVLRLRLERESVPLWQIHSGEGPADWDRSVLAGEAYGRWLWLVLRPAAALLVLAERWHLRDVSRLGPALIDLPFGHPRPSW